MDSKQYRTRASALLQQAHDLHQSVCATMTALGDDAGAIEWQTLYAVMSSVGVACDIMRESLHPHPSAFADAEVPMVCTVCRRPVGGEVGTGYWWHTDDADAMDCPSRNTIKAMVAAGNERIPGADDTDARARSAALDGADD